MNILHWVKEIKSKSGKLHFKRFAIIETSRFALYVHFIYEHDKDEYLHSHPWNFKSIILKGSYIEKFLAKNVLCESFEATRIRAPLSYSKGDRNYFHKIYKIINGPVITLFFTYGKHMQWYYKTGPGENDKITNSEYRLRRAIGG